MYLPTTRDGMLAAIGRCIWFDRIEPKTFVLVASKSGGNPFDSPSSKFVRPTAAEALAAVVARVQARNSFV